MIKSNLKDLLYVRRLSIREFSRMVDYRFETVRKMHNDDLTMIPLELIERACKALKCSPSELFSIYEDAPDKNDNEKAPTV